MRQVTRKGLITMAAAGGVLALSGGYAHADAGAASTATGSPGVLSGNSVSVPIDIPVNVCGNSVTVGGLINPTFGNDCENGSAQSRQDSGSQNRIGGGSGEGSQAGNGAQGGNAAQAGNTTATDRHGEPGTGRHRAGGAGAEGVAQGSPGILSGNAIQAPISVPVNVCGNSVSVIGLLNPTFGNSCSNDAEPPPPPPPPVKPPVTPETPVDPPVEPPANQPPEPNVPGPQLEPEEQLAQTGAGGMEMLIPASAGLLLAGMGSVLYRRSRSAA
ncbi:chaplin [Streptomyces cyaneofuscatus]|uniref:chaplin n=1 Tax=Streptomyces cyaneofuscatus TaxID=66883 RepID=UPI002D76B9E0|nr:chaplin [Streptomyces cyaneofuscatus]WRO09169.1 chaplin [Streptomyces cyaneofuscatus]